MKNPTIVGKDLPRMAKIDPCVFVSDSLERSVMLYSFYYTGLTYRMIDDGTKRHPYGSRCHSNVNIGQLRILLEQL